MKKLYLEFIRGAAAIVVLLYHCIELHPTGPGPKHFYFSNWGTDAVMIFFILSGIVINISQTRNPKSKSGFIGNRLLRLYPQLITGLLLGLLVMRITHSAMPSVGTVIGNFAMVSALKGYMSYIVPTIASNSPIWSLSYEMFFYLVFAILIGRMQKKSMIGWFIISLLMMPLYYFQLSKGLLGHLLGVGTFSSVWLAGYFIYEYRHKFYADKYAALFSIGILPLISRMHLSPIYYDPAKYLLFAVFAAPFFSYCLQTPQNGKKIRWYYMAVPYLAMVFLVFSQPYLTFNSFVFYSALPVVFMGIGLIISVFGLKSKTINFISRSGAVLGRYSYSIYIIHYPVFYFFAIKLRSPIIYALVSLPLVAILAYCLERWLQPAIVNLFRKLASIIAHQLHLSRVDKLAKV